MLQSSFKWRWIAWTKILHRRCSGCYRHWTEVDMLRRGCDAGRRWWGERCTAKVSCRLPCGAFLQLMCSQNTWWKVKVQWRLSIFMGIMLCHSAFPTPLVLPFLSLCCPSLGSFMWGQEWWFSSTSDPSQVQCAATRLPIHPQLTLLGQCESCPQIPGLKTFDIFKKKVDLLIITLLCISSHIMVVLFYSHLANVFNWQW